MRSAGSCWSVASRSPAISLHPSRPAHSTNWTGLPKSKPMVSLECRFLLLVVAAVLIFFIAGLLISLRFERVDNLGAYSIPPRDRPSHLICSRQQPSSHIIRLLTQAGGDRCPSAFV